ncbi:MAG: hypothetical protein II453_11130 [Alphaproteobacteria bacterium]|nr:hypothetical protein [Alphaproteobacteria bacterium]
MNVKILTQAFAERSHAVNWMEERYAEYPDGSIVSSCMTKDNNLTLCYIVIDLAKLKPEKKKLIKIT